MPSSKQKELLKYFDHQEPTMKLASSASDQNAYFTYVCLINDMKPSISSTKDHKRNSHSVNIVTDEDTDQEQPIQVERSKAVHELVETRKRDGGTLHKEQETDSLVPYTTQGCSDNNQCYLLPEDENTNNINCKNPNILKLTKMKWLSEDQKGSPDSSSPSLSPTPSNTSSDCSRESDDIVNRRVSFGDKCLSTILRLDREHNMFGLSNIAIVGTKPSRKIRKDDEKAVFHQTAIIQICCGKGCCKHKSNTDLPTSLKCGGCRGCCFDPSCPICLGSCGPPCDDPPCPSLCSACPNGKCICKIPCPPSKCMLDCANSFGLKISVNRKPKYEQSPVELTPRSSCVLQKPVAARSCHHIPQCIPPSSCFPYLMPCFWPSRPSAPCNTPARCFHNPPCLPPRQRRYSIPLEEQCPPGGKCADESKNIKCPNQMCIGNNPELKKEIESRYGTKK